MFAQPHAAVWIDHHEARVFHIALDHADEQRIVAPAHHLHRHPKSDSHERAEVPTHFFEEVARALEDSAEILIVGPGTAKTQFVHWLRDGARPVAKRVVGVETIDHPTTGELIAHARRHFRVPEARIGGRNRA